MNGTMETRSGKRKKISSGNGDGLDRISDLPDLVLHQILSLVSIKTIARTSVLSKRWRSIWSSFPDLDFTSISFAIKRSSSSSSLTSSTTSNKTDLITQALLNHSDLRILRFRGPISFSRLTALLRLAIRLNVHELDVEVTTDDYFNFPRCVLTSESLKVFRLKSAYPGFRLPPISIMIDGFRSLKSLSLSLVISYNQSSLVDLFTDSSFPLLTKLNLDDFLGLKQLKVSCRALQDLTLKKCYQLDSLEVSGTRLESLHVANCFDPDSDRSCVTIDADRLKNVVWKYNAIAITSTISLGDLTCLEEASIGLPEGSRLENLFDLLLRFSHANSNLTLDTQCVELLSNKKNIYRASCVSNPFNNLKSLELHTSFNRHNFRGLAYLFTTCPSVERLTLNIINDHKSTRKQWNKDLWVMSTSQVEQYWESRIVELKPFLEHLKFVKMDGFLECENEVSLAKFLLKHCKTLKDMTLSSGQCNSRDSLRRQKIRSQMMGFSKASSNATISFH